jgi:hypothetical protein
VRVSWQLFSVTVVVAYAVATLFLLPIGANDSRMLLAFWTDEAMHVNLLSQAVSVGTLRLEFVGYGHFFFNIALIAAHVARRLGPLTDFELTLILRVVAWASALICLHLTGTLAHRTLGPTWGLVAMSLMATTPTFIRMSVMSHPDTLELACIMACLLAMVNRLEHRGRYWPYAAAGCVGLAVAAKLGAFLLMPFVWIVDAPWRRRNLPPGRSISAARVSLGVIGVVALVSAVVLTPSFIIRNLTSDGRIDDPLVFKLLPLGRLSAAGFATVLGIVVAPPVWSRLNRRPWLMQFLLALLATSLTAAATFTMVSPMSWWRLSLIKVVLYERIAASHGNASGWEWLQIVGGPDLLGPIVLASAIAVITGLLLITSWRRNASFVLLASWVVAFSAVLVFGVRNRPSHYVLPALPFLIILAVHAWRMASQWIRRTGWTAIKAVAFAACALVAWQQAIRAHDAWHQLRYRVEQSGVMRVAQFLPTVVSTDSSIVFDYQIYVPPQFVNAKPTWGGSLYMLETERPAAVLVNRNIENLYTRKASQDPQHDPNAYYEALARGSTSYRLLAQLGEVSVYRRIDLDK